MLVIFGPPYSMIAYKQSNDVSDAKNTLIRHEHHLLPYIQS